MRSVSHDRAAKSCMLGLLGFLIADRGSGRKSHHSLTNDSHMRCNPVCICLLTRHIILAGCYMPTAHAILLFTRLRNDTVKY